MNSLERILKQRQKERKQLTVFLTLGVVGSLGLHLAALMVKVGSFGTLNPPRTPNETEITVVDVPEVFQSDIRPAVASRSPTTAEKSTSTPAPELSAAPASLPSRAVSPSTGKNSPTPLRSTPVNQQSRIVTNQTGEIPLPGGHGKIQAPNANGNGFGNASVSQPAGIPGGAFLGDPQGKMGGTPTGQPNGVPGGDASATAPPKPATTAPTAPASTNRPKPQCMSCPKPQYRGKEGAPKVTYDIAPDGRVINIRLRKSSGDPETDRATLETMSQWKFDPQTVPEGGQRDVRVRVTFEEQGSSYQRQNEQRRRQQQLEQGSVKTPPTPAQPIPKPATATAPPSIAPAPPIESAPPASPVPTVSAPEPTPVPPPTP